MQPVEPAAIVRVCAKIRGAATYMYKHILISTDGSETAQKGIDHGLALAKALSARVTLITVTEKFPMEATASAAGWAPSQSTFDEFDESQRITAQNILSAAKTQADTLGVGAEILHVPNASASEAILNAISSVKADAVVMASHGRRGIRKLLLGSQTQNVLAESTVPVIVVR